MTIQTIGLAVFVIVVAGNIAALLWDVFLNLAGLTLITTEARKYRWLARVLVAWNLIGAVGLWVHFQTWGLAP